MLQTSPKYKAKPAIGKTASPSPGRTARIAYPAKSTGTSTTQITGASGVHCRQVGKKPGLTQVGTAGSFSARFVQN